MKKEFTKEEKAAYYKGLRERWVKVKDLGNEDEIKAIMAERGINFSIRSYTYVLMQLQALGLEGIPYVDTKTFLGWKDSGFMVRKGEKSQIEGITWIAIDGKEIESPDESDNGNGNGKKRYALPKVYHLFHKSQVEELKGDA